MALSGSKSKVVAEQHGFKVYDTAEALRAPMSSWSACPT